MNLSQMTSLQQRLAISGIGTFLSIVAIYFSQVSIFKPIFTTTIALIICTAMWELYQIYLAKGLNPAKNIGISFGAIYVFSVALSTQVSAVKMLPELVLLIALISFFLYYFSKGTSPLLNLSATVFAIVYLAVPLSCMIRIVYFFNDLSIQDGRWWLFYLLAVTKTTDVGAFFVGKKFGKEKLAPYISPKKTWEGALGGFAGAIVASLAIYLFTSIFRIEAFSITLWQSLWLGAGIGVVAQFGDLSESLLKRDGGVKDSNQLPGLGGMLDIVDSLVFSAPFVYIFLKA